MGTADCRAPGHLRRPLPFYKTPCGLLPGKLRASKWATRTPRPANHGPPHANAAAATNRPAHALSHGSARGGLACAHSGSAPPMTWPASMPRKPRPKARQACPGFLKLHVRTGRVAAVGSNSAEKNCIYGVAARALLGHSSPASCSGVVLSVCAGWLNSNAW